jgi:hypothetical protein
MGPEQTHRIVSERAVGAAAVGHDVAIYRQFLDPLGQLIERDVNCAGEVSGDVLLSRSDVEEDDLTRVCLVEQVGHVDLFDVVGTHVVAPSEFGVRTMPLRDGVDVGHKGGDVVSCE